MSLPTPLIEKLEATAERIYSQKYTGFGKSGVKRVIKEGYKEGRKAFGEEVLGLCAMYEGDGRREKRSVTCEALVAGIKALLAKAEE